MSIKIAINGFGRIGMLTARRMLTEHLSLELVGINDLVNEGDLKKQFQKDIVYGSFEKNLDNVKFFQEKDPLNLPWGNLGVDIVLECSGFFTDIEGAKKHLMAGAKKVIISAPSNSVEIPTYLLGVNQKDYNPESDAVISMGSCTTNAVAPVIKILDENLGIENGFINTVHSYTSSQNKIYPNWRTDKASKLSIVPSTTGATKTVEKCLPNLQGKLNGLSLRVPTETGSMVELVLKVKKALSLEEINNILEKASQAESLRGILKVESGKQNSSNIKGSSYSAIVQIDLTQVLEDLVRVMIWYDNEFGYACRLAEITDYIGEKN